VEVSVKERLTGALIFVAVLVIVVDEVLSVPDAKVAGSQAATAQPADEGPPLRTYSMTLNDSADTRAGQAALTPQPAAASSAGIPAPVEPVAEPAVEAVPPAAEPVAAPPESPKPAAQPEAVPAGGRWWAQLGSFSARDNADRLAKQLRAAGYGIDVSKINANGKELFRVRAGPVQSRADAQALQARLASAGHKATIVAP
jgi:DedD protein